MVSDSSIVVTILQLRIIQLQLTFIMVDTFLDELKFVRCLGQGGYGIVFCGENPRTKYHSAVKFIRKDDGLSEKDQSMLGREAEICRKLPEHMNVVKVLDVLEKPFKEEDLEIMWNEEHMEISHHKFIDGVKGTAKRQGNVNLLLIQMELCGTTLRSWLIDPKVMTRKGTGIHTQQFSILMDISEGLKFLHDNKIMHRDVKPENIMFSLPTSDSEYTFPVKVGDFGLCRKWHTAQSKTSPLTKDVGTAEYMAPEVIDDNYGYQCDIFSFGLVAWEVVQHIEPPFRKEWFNALTFGHNYAAINVQPAFHNIKDLIIAMTQRSPSKRMKSLEAFKFSYVFSEDQLQGDPHNSLGQQTCAVPSQTKYSNQNGETAESVKTSSVTDTRPKDFDLKDLSINEDLTRDNKTHEMTLKDPAKIKIISASNAISFGYDLKDCLTKCTNGDTVVIPLNAQYNGVYMITADNVTLVGSWATVSQANSRTFLTIKASGCTIKHLTVVGEGSCIRIDGNNNKLLDVCIKSISSHGVVLSILGNKNIVKSCNISGGSSGMSLTGDDNNVTEVDTKNIGSYAIYAKGDRNSFSKINVEANGCKCPIQMQAGKDKYRAQITQLKLTTVGKWSIGTQDATFSDSELQGECMIAEKMNLSFLHVTFDRVRIKRCHTVKLENCLGNELQIRKDSNVEEVSCQFVKRVG